MVIGYIYKISNNVNNKVYIGQTYNKISKRWRAHKVAANNGDKRQLYCAMRKYGVINFSIEVIHVCYSENTATLTKTLDELEVIYIEEYDSFKNGYNLTTGGRNNICTCFKKESDYNIKNNKKSICMYDLYGKFIAKYDSMTQCAKANGFTLSKIGEVCNKEKTNYLNYVFRFFDGKNNCDICLDVTYGYRIQYKYFKIAEYDLNDNLIKIWDNSNEIAKIFKIKNKSQLYECCNGNIDIYFNKKWRFVFPDWYKHKAKN